MRTLLARFETVDGRDGAPTVQPAFDRTDVTGWSAFDVQGEDASWCQLTPTVPVDAGSGISPSRPVPVAGGRLPSRRRAVAGFDSCRPRRRACASHVGQRSPRHRVDHVEQVGRTIERLIPHLEPQQWSRNHGKGTWSAMKSSDPEVVTTSDVRNARLPAGANERLREHLPVSGSALQRREHESAIVPLVPTARRVSAICARLVRRSSSIGSVSAMVLTLWSFFTSAILRMLRTTPPPDLPIVRSGSLCVVGKLSGRYRRRRRRGTPRSADAPQAQAPYGEQTCASVNWPYHLGSPMSSTPSSWLRVQRFGRAFVAASRSARTSSNRIPDGVAIWSTASRCFRPFAVYVVPSMVSLACHPLGVLGVGRSLAGRRGVHRRSSEVSVIVHFVVRIPRASVAATSPLAGCGQAPAERSLGAERVVERPRCRSSAIAGWWISCGRLRLAGWWRSGDGSLGVECGDADQVVDRGGHLEPGSVALSASVAELASAGDGLGPPEWFLDAFADPLTHLVPGVSSGSRVDRGVSGVRRDVRGEPELADVGDEPFRVVGLVRSDRASTRDLRQGGTASQQRSRAPRSRRRW